VTRPPSTTPGPEGVLSGHGPRGHHKYVLKAARSRPGAWSPPTSRIHPGRLPDRDVDEAQRLLAAAGYPGGEGFPSGTPLQHLGGPQTDRGSAPGQWKEALGVKVDLVNRSGVFLHTANRRLLDHAGRWIGDYLDPNTFSTSGRAGTEHRTGFADPGYDDLIARAAVTLDPDERLELLRQAEDWILNRETIVMPLYFYVVQNLYDEQDFAGLHPTCSTSSP